MIIFFFLRWDFGYCGHYWPIVPAPDDSDGDCGEIDEIKIGKGIINDISRSVCTTTFTNNKTK
jgi:hypothetical protein